MKNFFKIALVAIFSFTLFACNQDSVKDEFIQYEKWGQSQHLEQLGSEMMSIAQAGSAEETAAAYKKLSERFANLSSELAKQTYTSEKIKSIQDKAVAAFSGLAKLTEESAQYVNKDVPSDVQQKITDERNKALQLLIAAGKEENALAAELKVTPADIK